MFSLSANHTNDLQKIFENKCLLALTSTKAVFAFIGSSCNNQLHELLGEL